MPPRRSARVAAAVERATTALSPLPLSVVLHIFSLLPVDCRLRCAEVCRCWRSVLTERSLWTRLDLSVTSGVFVRAPPDFRKPLDALLRCAAVRSGGALQSLHINGGCVSHETLLEVVAANGGALGELHARDGVTWNGFSAAEGEALLSAAPLLRVFGTGMYCTDEDAQVARRALRNEAPFGPLRVHTLYAEVDIDEAAVLAFAADVAAHASLRGLVLFGAPLSTAAALDAVVDAALARRMQAVTLNYCGITPASAPALARLLRSDALTTLECWGNTNMLDAPAAAELAAALRDNATLTSLKVCDAGVFDDASAAAALLGALNGHARLRLLWLDGNRVAAADLAALGASLGALVAANAPALTDLDVSSCALGDEGLRALVAALPHNTHLRTLNVSDDATSDAFSRDVLLPAVRANTSLRRLVIYDDLFGYADADISREMQSRAQQ
jgi:hypothetical protein